MDNEAALPPDADRVSLREHVLETEIGAFTEERGVTQRLIFNVQIDVRRGPLVIGDDVDRIFSYDLIVEAIEEEVRAARVDLLETLAEGICSRLLAHPRADTARVRIEKPDRVSGRLGVEIIRSEAGGTRPELTGPRPHVYCLAESAWMKPWFAAWIAALPEGPAAFAIEGARIDGADTATVRIRFLASETAAWAMRGSVPGADVVASRTELDHAFRSGRRAIWAPSKMIFAAKGLDEAVLSDFGRAAGWFAGEMRATALTFVGREAPAGLGFDGPVEVARPGQ